MSTNRYSPADRPNRLHIFRGPKGLFAAISILALSAVVSAAPPLWWTQLNALNSQPINDSAVVNQGQLKHFTQKAVEEMNTRLPGGAGPELNSLVQGWKDYHLNHNYSPTNSDPKDFEAISAGQLKFIANKIHARLIEIRYQDQLPTWLAQNPGADNQLINIGQLKTVFEFDLAAASGQLPQWWQKYYFNTTGLNPNAIPEGNTISYLTQYENGSIPTTPINPGTGAPGSGGENANSPEPDTDGDGLADSEDAVPNDPLINWKKTPAFQYLWIPVEAPVGYRAIDINNRGQILFTNSAFVTAITRSNWFVDTENIPAGKIWDPTKPANDRWEDIYLRLPPFSLSVSAWSSITSLREVQSRQLSPPNNIQPQHFGLKCLGDDGSVMANFDFQYSEREYIKNGSEWNIYSIASFGVLRWNRNTEGTYDTCQLMGQNLGFKSIKQTDPNSEAEFVSKVNYAAGYYTDEQGIPRIAIHDHLVTNTSSIDTILSYSLTENSLRKPTTLSGFPDSSVASSSQQFTRSGRMLMGTRIDDKIKYFVSGSIEVEGANEDTTLTDLPGGGWAVGSPDDALRVFKDEKLKTTTVTGVTEIDENGTGIGGVHLHTPSASGRDIWRNGEWLSFKDATGKDNIPSALAPKRMTAKGIIWASDGTAKNGILIPVAMDAYERGTINTPGRSVSRSTEPDAIYEVVTLENADYDEYEGWAPNSMESTADSSRQDGATNFVHPNKDDDFVKIHLQHLQLDIGGNIQLLMDQPGNGDGVKMRADDLHFYTRQGTKIELENLRINDLKIPSGPLAAMLQPDGLDLFIEIANLGAVTQDYDHSNHNSRRYADLILRSTIGDSSNDQKIRIYRGGYWRNQRHGNNGSIGFYDGKGRHQDAHGDWRIDIGKMVHGPFSIQSGKPGVTNSSTRNLGPTPAGWYGIYERLDFTTQWSPGGRPQLDHSISRNGALGYVQQGSYCQWSAPGNRASADAHGNYQHAGANSPPSIHFKFELVESYEITNRNLLQIHPDGFNDGTAGCIGLQNYEDCCKIFFLLRHYFQSNLQVIEN